MKTYSQGSIRKHRKYNGDWEWQGFICVTAEDGSHKQLTKMTGIECSAPRNGEKRSATGKGSKQALDIVKRWRDELVAQEATANATPDVTEETVVEFVKRYIKTLDIEPATAQTYKYLLAHIELLNKPIAELTPQDAEQWKLDMLENGVGDHMRRKTFNLLKYACNWGVSVEALVRSPLAAVKAPPQPKHEPNPLDPSELPRLLSLLDTLMMTKPEFSDMVRLALNTGMRRGELCALRWQDIDGFADGGFDGCIHVNRVIANKDGGTYLKDYPKNGNRRQVDINDAIKTILNRRKAALEPLVSDLSACYVFGYKATPDAYPAPSYITKLWNMFASMNALVGVEGKPLRFHDLRDTFATTALVNGVPIVTVAAILGHENSNTTYRHYAHFIPSKNKDTMELMSDLLNGSSSS